MSVPGKSFGRRVFDVLSGFGLTVTVLILLLYVTWRGTLAQVDMGLHDAVRKYFDSPVLLDDLSKIPLPYTDRRIPFSIPMVGAHLLLWVLFVNLVLGGIVRMRRTRSTLGVLIVHIGIIVMLAAGLVKFVDSDEGFIKFHPGQTKSEFASFLDWEIAVSEPAKDGKVVERVLDPEKLRNLRQQDRATIQLAGLPFELAIHGYQRNSEPVHVHSDRIADREVVDRFVLRADEPLVESEANFPGCYLEVVENGAVKAKTILWGGLEAFSGQDLPFVYEREGARYAIELRRKRYPLDFAVRLDRFSKRDHPGIDSPRDYRSWVTRLEGNAQQSVQISMNEPMRHSGYIFFQSKYGNPDRWSGGEMYSILQVVRNPSDQWPLISCVIIAIGLLLHFSRKLYGFARAQAAQRVTA